MTQFFLSCFACFSAFFRSRCSLGLEIIALRQQLGVLKRKNPRPRLQIHDRIFWILLRRLWPAWKKALVIVKPETVVGWHRAGFRFFWRLRSRSKNPGRPRISAETRALILQMAHENATRGAPRIHGELLKLGLDISERTVSRYLRRICPSSNAGKLWAAFLRNHREAIAAMDFFTVPTFTFGVLYCFFVIEHSRRKILHFNVTEHPTASWIVQQLRETFREPCPYRYVIRDRDGKYSKDVTDLLTAIGLKPTRISFASPWQNGIAERCVESCRRDLLDHMIVLNDVHLRRLLRDYIYYYHTDRIHDSLEKDTPAIRPVISKRYQSARLISRPRLGGLHHRYDWQQAA